MGLTNRDNRKRRVTTLPSLLQRPELRAQAWHDGSEMSRFEGDDHPGLIENGDRALFRDPANRSAHEPAVRAFVAWSCGAAV